MDSFLGFADSLAVAREGLRYVPVSHHSKNLKTDLHLQKETFHRRRRPDEDPDGEQEAPVRSRQVMIRDAPHLHIGYINGYPEASVYIIFPHLEYEGEQFEALTLEQQRRWTDRVFLQAIHRRLGSNFTQHLPANFDCAYNNARASVENRRRKEGHYQRHIGPGYFIHHEELAGIWGDVVRTLENEPGLDDFRGAYIFINAKGTKLHHRSQEGGQAMRDVLEAFTVFIERILDTGHV
ncbi:MAG: hypothetical protein INR71_03215 [Terriglobus roseus]|nr:hypothetical protein [Terriglobus roseus]